MYWAVRVGPYAGRGTLEIQFGEGGSDADHGDETVVLQLCCDSRWATVFENNLKVAPSLGR